jgi:hypothetical protein
MNQHHTDSVARSLGHGVSRRTELNRFAGAGALATW